jgi:general stress protein YciG
MVAEKSKRGFASMDAEKQREIASKGGKAAHAKGTAHEFTSQEAREAGRKGGETTSKDREFMSEIGREGGKRSHRGSREQNGNGSNGNGSNGNGSNGNGTHGDVEAKANGGGQQTKAKRQTQKTK